MSVHLSLLLRQAFLVPRADGPSSYDLRWFTPTDEVDLCGHATLASSSVLWDIHGADVTRPIRFHTKSGVLTATRDESGVIALDFPAEGAHAVPLEDVADALVSAFGLRGVDDILWVRRIRRRRRPRECGHALPASFTRAHA